MPNYPTSLDTLTNPTSSDTLASPAHATQHADANDIVEALEAKVGIGASTPTTAGHVLTVTGAGASAWQVGAGTDSVARIAAALTTVATGNYWRPQFTNLAISTAVIAANTHYATPLVIGATQTFDRISINVSAASAGNARLGIYASDATTMLPTTLILDAGTVSTGTTGAKEITISQQLTPALYWITVLFEATPTVSIVIVGAQRFFFGASSPSGAGVSHVTKTLAFGVLPDPYGAPDASPSSSYPAVSLRAA